MYDRSGARPDRALPRVLLSHILVVGDSVKAKSLKQCQGVERPAHMPELRPTAVRDIPKRLCPPVMDIRLVRRRPHHSIGLWRDACLDEVGSNIVSSLPRSKITLGLREADRSTDDLRSHVSECTGTCSRISR